MTPFAPVACAVSNVTIGLTPVMESVSDSVVRKGPRVERRRAVGLERIHRHVATLNNNREDASSMVIAGATANTTEGNSRASRESGWLCSH